MKVTRMSERSETKVAVDLLVRRLRKYGTGSPDALLLMREAADMLEHLIDELYGPHPGVCPENWPENMNS
jgi:hypothetical protein